MLENCIFVRQAWLQDPDNLAAITGFLKASFKGWMDCRGNSPDYVGT